MERTAERFFLQRGQSLHLHAGPASDILIVRGRLSVTQAPQWLGEQVVMSDFSLEEGQAHPIEAAGWIRLTALAPAEIIALRRMNGVPAWRDFPVRLLALVEAWRRRLSGRRA